MNGKLGQFKENLRHISIKSVVVAVIVLAVTIGMVTFVGRHYYDTEKEVLLQQGELNALESAKEYDKCLITRANIVTLVGCTIEDMINSGSRNDKIEQYLTDQTDNVIETLDPSSTGLYGWINGEYLDGSGWVPDADYVPTERPWYIQAQESDQKITFVEPYLDMQTKTVMMTVSELMDDGESVLAMDVSLEPLQQIVEEVASVAEGSQALILDTNGIVVAHSDENQLGKNYLAETDSLGKALAEKIINEGRKQFSLKTDEGNYSVYVDRLEGRWYSVSLINSDIWNRPLRRAMIIYAVVVTLIIGFLVFIFLHLNAKNLALQKLLARIDQEEKRGKEYKILSETDRMTGLYDHTSGKQKVDKQLSYGVEGIFLELDIDSFKSINDTYGHQTGDSVIIAVADALRSTFRSNDITMRLGGDEFGVFAVGIVRKELAEAIIRRLFQRIDSIEIPELKGKKISISVGIVFSSGKTKSFDELYACADTAMYISKKTSGNCLTLSE